MWENRDTFNGLSILPHDGGTYQQAPFETTDKRTYNKLAKNLTTIDLTKIKEDQDLTSLQGEVACGGGGSCEIT